MSGPPCHRLGDLCTGHDCWPPRPNATASPNVFCNKIPVHRLGDIWKVHCCPPPCHGGTTVGGSSTVFVNGRPCTRIGDPVNCGSNCGTGSPDVFIGG